MREIELDDGIWDEAGDEVLFLVSEELNLKWPSEEVEYADWKDDQAKFDGVAKVGARGGECVVLQDGSDCYIFASMSDALPLK